MKILIIEDEESQRIALQDDLVEAGYEATAVGSPEIALDLFKNEAFDVILSDLKMPGMDGMALLERIQVIQPEVTVIVLTACGTADSGLLAMKLGAYNYLIKPFSRDELLLLLKRVEEFRSILAENRLLRKQLEARYAFGRLDGDELNLKQLNGPTALDESVAQFETKLIREALAKTGGNKAKAAKMLRVPASTLKSKMKKYNIG